MPESELAAIEDGGHPRRGDNEGVGLSLRANVADAQRGAKTGRQARGDRRDTARRWTARATSRETARQR
ncbi:hypothetical protein NDU88_006111 [Pleurodeles waltl]|uniref:Uncharacterized protein n=1 Tax=Pleurodeles waltl TaxID=8319 RepID=A0AAV7WCG7_PLEWA|nr:hypothetical protein NDU88_006111 [Pleurodeles waltl]